jgi:3-deoxy-7-phosphoheptulonate synthase
VSGIRSITSALADCAPREAAQQPLWGDPAAVERVRHELRRRAPLVGTASVRALRSALAEVAAGEGHVVQAGDCAEDPARCTAEHVEGMVALIDTLADAMHGITRAPVVRVGRMAGQLAKPRSSATERVGDVELPSYRGHMVNSPEAELEARRPDPQRMLAGYRLARRVIGHLEWHAASQTRADSPIWVSHEALLLDYETPMLRRDEIGCLVLASTHWPWVGERTRQPEGAHVALLADVVNPVACKIGPAAGVDDVLDLCERLDPAREPGRLTLIARMGATRVRRLLPPLVAAVRRAGHPVIWLCDPMHGNTITSPGGRKTRLMEAIVGEVRQFQDAVEIAGGRAGGLHLEVTPEDVTECAGDRTHLDRAGDRYESLCDPRLNPHQAVSVVSEWRR